MKSEAKKRGRERKGNYKELKAWEKLRTLRARASWIEHWRARVRGAGRRDKLKLMEEDAQCVPAKTESSRYQSDAQIERPEFPRHRR